MKFSSSNQGPAKRAATASGRQAFTLIELTIVAMLMAIVASVAIPKWSQSLERAKGANFQRAVETDIAYLRRVSVRQGKPRQLSIQPATSSIVISPAMPSVLGNAGGVVNYGDRFPGVTFVSVDFNGSQSCTINLYGELVSNSTGQRLNTARMTIKSGSTTRASDLVSGI